MIVPLSWDLGEMEEPGDWLLAYAWEGVPTLSIARVPGGYFVRCHDVADFFVARDGSRAEGRKRQGVDPERARFAFEHQVLPATFQLAGAIALHASSVATPSSTVAFVGPSGAGKSTLAATLSGGDWRLVGDDFLALEVSADEVIALPSRGPVRLRTGTADALGEGTWAWGKFAVSRPVLDAPSHLSRVYDIGEASDAVTIEPLSRREAAMALAKNLHRMDPTDPALLTRELDAVETITSVVRVSRLRYPRSFDALPAVRAAIERDLHAERDR